MRDPRDETGIFDVQPDGPLDVGRYDARIGDSQLTINLKLLALGHELARISDAIVETHKVHTGGTIYRRNQALSLAYRYFESFFKLHPSRARHLIQVARRFSSKINRQSLEVFSWTDLRTLVSYDDVAVAIALEGKLRDPGMTNKQLSALLCQRAKHSVVENAGDDSLDQ